MIESLQSIIYYAHSTKQHTDDFHNRLPKAQGFSCVFRPGL